MNNNQKSLLSQNEHLSGERQGINKINQPITQVWWPWMLRRERIKECGAGVRMRSYQFPLFIIEGLIVETAFETASKQVRTKSCTYLGREHWGRVFLGGRRNSRLARRNRSESLKKLARCWLLFLSKIEANGGTDTLDLVSKGSEQLLYENNTWGRIGKADSILAKIN